MFFFILLCLAPIFFFFFFNDTATTEIYTLSLHDALPISFLRQIIQRENCCHRTDRNTGAAVNALSGIDVQLRHFIERDRKSTRLNSSHLVISYAVFCLKKKK